MGVFVTPVDTWATGQNAIIATIILQSICLLVTIVLCIIRICSICRIRKQFKTNWKLAILHISQLLMLIFSVAYLFLYEWNYVHFFLPSNILGCTVWWRLIVTSHPLTRILLFTFLMLRSSFVFQGTWCHLSFKFTIPIVVIAAAMGISTPLVEIFNDNIAFHPLPNVGVCMRSVKPKGLLMAMLYHGVNSILSIVVLIIFYAKARSVKKQIAILQKNPDFQANLRDVHSEFNKHVKYGALTIVGNIALNVCYEIFSVFLGISSTLDQTVNNVLTTCMFEQVCLCCAPYNRVHVTNEFDGRTDNIIEMGKETQTENYTLTTKLCHQNDADKNLETRSLKSTTAETMDTTTTAADTSVSGIPGLHKDISTFDAHPSQTVSP